MFSYHFQGAANEVYFGGFFIIMDGPCSTFETENICNYCDNTKKIKIGLRGRHFFRLLLQIILLQHVQLILKEFILLSFS